MTDLTIDRGTGDLQIQNGDLVLIPTIQELVRQQVQITLSTFRGEWSYNTEFGVPYVANENNPIQIFSKTSKNIFDLRMREAIQSTEGVVGIDSYSSVRDPRSQLITVTFTATTNSGNISDSIEINI
jgi:hypothetical protein